MATEHAAVSDTAPLVSGFLDRLGDRIQVSGRGSGHVEVLRLRPELTVSPLFEPAVRRRAEQLAGFVHPNCAKVRQIGRLPAPDGRLVVVSDAVDGWRLSEVLEAAGPCGVAIHADAALFLLRQLLDTVAALHVVAPGISHGALGTERLIVTADGRLVVTESVLGGALWHLPQMSPDRLWRDLRLAVADGEARPFGRRTDLRQIGIIALSLALGRQLRRDEYPARLASLVQEWTPASPGVGADALGPAIRGWLLRVLSLTDELTPWSVAEARSELNRLVESNPRYSFAPTGLPAVLRAVADYYAAASEAPVPVAAPAALAAAHARLAEARLVEASPVIHAAPAALDARLPAADIPPPAPEVPQPALDEFRPDPADQPAVDHAIDSHRVAPAETRPASMFAEPLSPSMAASVGPAAGVGPLADSIAGKWSDAVADPGEGRQREAPSPAWASSPRSLLGADLAEADDAAVATPSGARTRTLIGIGAAAVVILALGGYAIVRPSSVGATADRRASSPPQTAAADAANEAAASPAAPAPRADTSRPPATPRTPEAQPPAAAPEPPVSAGTLEIVSPRTLNVSEGGRPLGASGAPIQLSAGRHTLDIGREDLGYREVQVVDVKPGRALRIEPPLPSGFANLNATPWAEVWIDGRKVGETPLGRVQLTIGSHEVQFRHPELGDQTRTLVVTTASVALLSVDMKK